MSKNPVNEMDDFPDFELSQKNITKTESLTSQEEQEIIQNDIDDSVKDWLALNNLEGSEIKCTLYKYVNSDQGTERSQIAEYRNAVPSAHEIGIRFGSGKYIMILVVPKQGKRPRQITTRTIRLHANYDNLMMDERKKSMPEAMQGINPYIIQQQLPPQQDTMKATLSIMREVFAMLTPLLASRNNTGNGGGVKEIIQEYAALKDILKINAQDNINFYSEMQRKAIEMSPETIETEKPSIIEQLIPLLNNLVPALLKNDKKAIATVNTVKMMPQFKDVVNNTGDIKKLVDHLDKSYGKVKVNGLLKKFNIVRPD